MKEEEEAADGGGEYFILWHLLGHNFSNENKDMYAMQRLQKYHKDNLLFQFMFLANDNDNIYHEGKSKEMQLIIITCKITESWCKWVNMP